MWLPTSALVFGYGTEAKAVCAIMRLFFRESCCCSPNVLEKEITVKHSSSETVLVVLLSTALRESKTSHTISQLASLRFQHEWRGPVLVIADNDEVQTLQKWDLFKLQQKSPYVAQVCLTRPLLVNELLSALPILRPYGPGALRVMIQTIKEQNKILEAWKLYVEIESGIAKSLWLHGSIMKLLRMLLDQKLIFKDLIGHDRCQSLKRLADDLQTTKMPALQGDVVSKGSQVISTLKNVMECLPRIGRNDTDERENKSARG